MKVMYKKVGFVLSLSLIISLVFTFSTLSASADAVRMGDVDGNGRVQAMDSLIIQRYVAGSDKLTAAQLAVSDVNHDGRVTVIDAFKILQYVSGRIYSFDDGISDNDYADEVLRLVNAEREKEGLPPLVLDNNACAAADLRAAEVEKVFDHSRPDGTACFTVLDEFNIEYSAAGENIARGYLTPEDVVQAWLDSEGHRENIMSSKFTAMGVGMYFDEDSLYGYYWTQVFIG